MAGSRFPPISRPAATPSLYLVASGGTPAGQQGRRQQSALDLLAVLGGTRTGHGRRQRTHHRRLRVHRRAVHQRGVDLRESARASDRRRECAEPGRSRDRRMGQGAARSAQQLDDHDDGEPGHARLAHHRFRHGGQRRLARPLPQGGDTARRSGAEEHA